MLSRLSDFVHQFFECGLIFATFTRNYVFLKKPFLVLLFFFLKTPMLLVKLFLHNSFQESLHCLREGGHCANRRLTFCRHTKRQDKIVKNR